jgi:hypothetical protein
MARPVPTAVAVGAVFAAVVGASAYVAVARQATPAVSSRLQFVACPIVRDTKTQPCWLAEHEGELYYLGQQGGVANNFLPSQLGHQALVEATRGQGRGVRRDPAR